MRLGKENDTGGYMFNLNSMPGYRGDQNELSAHYSQDNNPLRKIPIGKYPVNLGRQKANPDKSQNEQSVVAKTDRLKNLIQS